MEAEGRRCDWRRVNFDIGRRSMTDQLLYAKDVAERELADAVAEYEAFASDLTARRLLGDGWHTALQVRVDAVERAQRAYRAAKEQTPVPTPEQKFAANIGEAMRKFERDVADLSSEDRAVELHRMDQWLSRPA
jgi:hypothetical protein